MAAAALICAIARGGGSALWRDGSFYWDEALRLCSSHLSHPCQVCGCACACMYGWVCSMLMSKKYGRAKEGT